MPAGTLTLTNNSAVVKGAGTAFNTELKAGDMIVSVVGGVTYTLPVKTVDSATQATLIKAYDGPTQAGAAWYAVPREMQNSITAQLVSEATKAMRGMNYDKQNWQQFFTADGDVTITLPDNSQSTGPSAKKLIGSVDGKADKTDLKDYAKLSGPTFTGPVITSGAGTSGASHYSREFKSILKGYVNSAGEEMYVSLFMNQIDAVDTFATLRVNAYAAVQDFTYNSGGNGTAPGSWINNSDKRLKTNITVISEPLEKMKCLRGYRWDRVDGITPGMGFVAQEVQDVFPDQVFSGSSRKLDDGTVIDRVLSVDAIGVSAALHHEAILALMDRIDHQDELIKKLMENYK